MMVAFDLAGARLSAHPSGALWWADRRILTVADLHLGKPDRMARQGGPLLPPYDAAETLTRLSDVIEALRPATVICLGDSFDDPTAAETLDSATSETVVRLAAGRRWIWIAGNHDPGPVDLTGEHREEFRQDGLTFRHIADPGRGPDISGHHHPKAILQARGRRIARRCFARDASRLILPAFGAYTGGLDVTDPAMTGLLNEDAEVLLLGQPILRAPLSGLTKSARRGRR